MEEEVPAPQGKEAAEGVSPTERVVAKLSVRRLHPEVKITDESAVTNQGSRRRVRQRNRENDLGDDDWRERIGVNGTTLATRRARSIA